MIETRPQCEAVGEWMVREGGRAGGGWHPYMHGYPYYIRARLDAGCETGSR